MKLTILAAGKIKEQYYSDAVKEYSKRLSRYASLSIEEVMDEPTPEKAGASQKARILDKEGERFLKILARYPGAYVIALAIDGKMFDSVSFSSHLSDLNVRGNSHLIFVIGGSLGLSAQVLDKADEKISFSRMTFPHQLMRVILLEQIYRAQRIGRGEPYHK